MYYFIYLFYILDFNNFKWRSQDIFHNFFAAITNYTVLLYRLPEFAQDIHPFPFKKILTNKMTIIYDNLLDVIVVRRPRGRCFFATTTTTTAARPLLSTLVGITVALLLLLSHHPAAAAAASALAFEEPPPPSSSSQPVVVEDNNHRYYHTAIGGVGKGN